MKTTIYCILLTMLIYSCTAKRDIGGYYKSVNEAERAIVSGDLKKASVHYRKAFRKNIHPFHRDLENALIVEVERGKHTVLISKYSSLLFQAGMDYPDDSDDRLVIYLKKSPFAKEINEAFAKSNPMLSDTLKVNVELKELLDLDQDIRYFGDKMTVGDKYNGPYRDTIMKTDAFVQERLIEILKEIKLEDIPYFSKKSMLAIDVTIGHSMAWSKFPAETLYLDLVQQGLLDARKFAFTVDKLSDQPFGQSDTLTGQSGRYGNALGFASGDYFFITQGNTPHYKFDIATIQKNRENLHLNDVYEDLERIAWGKFCSALPYKFSPYSSYAADSEFPQSYIANIASMSLPVLIIDKAWCPSE
ncbi:MAG: hypothetical protein ACK4WD_03155 [Flavobacteriales bacterium]|jgi:hypothetical protein